MLICRSVQNADIRFPPTSSPLFCRECVGPRVSETSKFCDKCRANTGPANTVGSNTARQNRLIDSPLIKLFGTIILILMVILVGAYMLVTNMSSTMSYGSVSNDRFFSQDLSSMALTMSISVTKVLVTWKGSTHPRPFLFDE